MNKTITQMSKEDFKKVPHAKWDECLEAFNSLVIIPTDHTHDSGYMCMEFCAVNDKDEPIAMLSGWSDVLNIDGIGGYGCNWMERIEIPSSIPVKGWTIDCLPCGYLRLFSSIHNGLKSGCALSIFEVFAERGERRMSLGTMEQRTEGMKNPRCNWEYTGEFDTNKQGSIKMAMYRTDCGRDVKWTRGNKIGQLFKDYGNQSVPQYMDFYVKCPYCGKVLNIYNPYDDGETWRE